MPLTDTAIRAAKPSEKQRKLFDGSGLYLLVSRPVQKSGVSNTTFTERKSSYRWGIIPQFP